MKPVPVLMLSIIYLLVSCAKCPEDYDYIPEYWKGFIYNDGDTLIYKSDLNRADTFIISKQEGFTGNNYFTYNPFCIAKEADEFIEIDIKKITDDTCLVVYENSDSCNSVFNIRIQGVSPGPHISTGPYDLRDEAIFIAEIEPEYSQQINENIFDSVYMFTLGVSKIEIIFNIEHGILQYKLPTEETCSLKID